MQNSRSQKSVSVFLLVACFTFAASGCGADPTPTAQAPVQASPAPSEEEAQATSFELTSTAFAHEEPIPGKYTCDGENVSPPLQWNNSPDDTQSFALIMDDPDAPVGIWIHWVLYNIPAETDALPEAIHSEADGSRHGKNSWRRADYGGPCPPSGTHRYFFKLYALDTVLDLEGSATKDQLFQAMEGHVLAEAELMGTYRKQ